MNRKTSTPKPPEKLKGDPGTVCHEHRNGKDIVAMDLIQEVRKAATLSSKIASKTVPSRDTIIKNLEDAGWPHKVKIDSETNITTTSRKRKTALCLQTGNMGRMYADMLKLQKLFIKGDITAGIIVVPTRNLTRVWGRSDANLVNMERMVSELTVFAEIITVPLVIIGIATAEDLKTA